MTYNKFNIKERKALLKKKIRRRKVTRLILFLSIPITFFLLNNIFHKKSNFNFTTSVHNDDLSSTNSNPFTVIVDPGHGDWDYGTIGSIGSTDVNEKDIVLAIGVLLGELLEKNNSIKVIYTRTTDNLPWLTTANDSLKERIKISEIAHADAFISIHCNSDSNKKSSGFEVWYKKDDRNGLLLSQSIQTELSRLSYSNNRGLKFATSEDDSFAVVEKNPSTSILIEVGFLSDDNDIKYLTSSIGQNALANSIYNGIINYKNKISLNN